MLSNEIDRPRSPSKMSKSKQKTNDKMMLKIFKTVYINNKTNIGLDIQSFTLDSQ